MGTSRAKAYECTHTGDLPVIPLGCRLVVPAHALDQMLEAGEHVAMPTRASLPVEQ